MADVHNTATRSRNMAAIKGKDTKAEVWLRKRLFALGFRFHKNRKDLPGKPDIVFPKYKAVVMYHGCFWHAHGCNLFSMPEKHRKFWEEKLGANKKRDTRNRRLLEEKGWRVLEVWECCLRGRGRLDPDKLIQEVAKWIITPARPSQEIVGEAQGEDVKDL